MGYFMARNILGAGIALRGYDISGYACARFSEAGGQVAGSAVEAARGTSLLLVMVATADQVRDALFGSGMAEALDPGGTVLLCSTVSPGDVREIAESLEGLGHAVLDAPVSGGQAGAEAGTLTVMASGPPTAFRRAEPVLEAISGKVHRLGDEPGLGATYKVVHQLAAGVHLVAAAELMALGVKAGCEASTLLEVVTTSAGYSWMLGDRGPRMSQRSPKATSSVDIFIKDLGLVLDTGRDCGAVLPLAAAAHQMLVAAGAMGFGVADDSEVVRAYEALSGVSLCDNLGRGSGRGE